MNADQRISILIEEIIKKRQPLAEQINSVIEQIKKYKAKLNEIQHHRNDILSRSQDRVVLHNLSELDFSQLARELDQHLIALKKLKRRFSRPTLNLGVVGRARQGKSHLLCRLSGLNPGQGIIPTGDVADCTGTRIKVFHQRDSKVKGLVYPHSETSFLTEVIAPYYKKLYPGITPSTIKEFYSSFHSIPIPRDVGQSAELGAMYNHLSNYHQHLNEYADLLIKQPFQIEEKQIREYVAQDNHDGTEKYYKYLAIREVNIMCDFPHEDIGRIGLVDMPGLGDTTTGEEERLIKTLSEDIDAILFVRRPISGGDDWRKEDVKLYDITRKAIPNLDLNYWSFMVLNHDRVRGNFKLCNIFREHIIDKNMRVARTFICDCESTVETGEMLRNIINYMLEQDLESNNDKCRIEVLDNRYAMQCQTDLLDWRTRYHAKLEKARSALETYGKKDTYPKFRKVWLDLCKNLVSLKDEADERSNIPDSNFVEQVEQVLEHSRNRFKVPSLEEIESKRKEKKGVLVDAHSEYISEMRSNLSKCFLELDGAVQRSLISEKTKIVEILREQASLKGISRHKDEVFLEELIKLFDRVPENLVELKSGFTYLLNFNVAYAAIIQRSVRRYLDDLHPDKKLDIQEQLSYQELEKLNQKLNFADVSEIAQEKPEVLVKKLREWWQQQQNDDNENILSQYDLSDEKYEDALSQYDLSDKERILFQKAIVSSKFTASSVQSSLKRLHQQTIDSCSTQLHQLLSEPNQLRYTMVAEFVDRILTKEAKDEWRRFLDNDAVASKVWDEFKNIKIQISEKSHWVSLIGLALSVSKEDTLEFIEI